MKTTEKHLDDPTLRASVQRCQKHGLKGRFACGPGLSCVVTEAGNARFVHRYPYGGKYESLWLDGTYPRDVTLTEALRQCEAHRALLDKRLNPKSARKSGGNVLNPTLAEYADQVFEVLAPPKEVKLGKKKSQWLRDMTKLVGPLAKMKIDSIVRTQVKEAMAPRWRGKVASPSARRIINRLAKVLLHRYLDTHPDRRDWSNPADWEALSFLLGDKGHRGKRRPSLSWRDAPAFMVRLRAIELMSARALEWVILSGSRSAETTGARWQEIDWKQRTWTIPVERLKTEQNLEHDGKPFVVPLSLAMVRLLRRAARNRNDLGPKDLIFPSGYSHALTRIHQHTLLDVARSIRPEISVHGFRSTLLAWGVGTPHRDRPPFDLALMDRVIGHQIHTAEPRPGEEKVSAAAIHYAHDAGEDLYLGLRPAVMREWSAYLNGRTHSPKHGPKKEAPAERPQLKLAA